MDDIKKQPVEEMKSADEESNEDAYSEDRDQVNDADTGKNDSQKQMDDQQTDQ